MTDENAHIGPLVTLSRGIGSAGHPLMVPKVNIPAMLGNDDLKNTDLQRI
jgi:hypothetical protein